MKLGIQTLGGDKGGIFVAAGHGAWGRAVSNVPHLGQHTNQTPGISQSLGTGKVMTELICGQPTSVSIKALALPA